MLKKVSNSQLKKSLIDSLEYNKKALDYVENCIITQDNILKFNSNDFVAKDAKENLLYIKTTLKFLSESYNQSLKKVSK